MRTRYLVYKRGFEGEWYLYKEYKKDEGYDIFFNLGVFNVRKDGFLVMQGGAQNFYYEIEKYDEDSF